MKKEEAVKNGKTGLARLVSAFGNSMSGLKIAYSTEAAFREEIWLSLVLVPLAFFVGDTAFERSALIASVLLLLVVELLNSAVEKTVDRIGFEYHELSGAAKDIGSAAVFLTMLLVGLVWISALLT